MLAQASSTALIDQYRESHHAVARMLAAGIPESYIMRRLGYTRRRLTNLQRSPAFLQLIADYKEEVFEQINQETDAFAELAITNMVAAERHINDRINLLDDANELLPLRDAMALAADGKDRFGYSKRVTQTNVNIDIAVRMDKAIERSSKVLAQPKQIEGRATEVLTPPPGVPPSSQPSVSLGERSQPQTKASPPTLEGVLKKQFLRR
jgi:hypothetical protein